jgi:hypothetical protein
MEHGLRGFKLANQLQSELGNKVLKYDLACWKIYTKLA